MAIVLAGSRPGRDTLAEQFEVDLKTLIPVAGEPMVRRPVQALLAAKSVGQVIVLAQEPERIAKALPADSRVTVRQSKGTIAATMLKLCEDAQTEWPLLVTTADHALLDCEMIDEFCKAANSADLSIGIVERSALMRRFPETERTWLHFRGGAYTGANLFGLRSARVASAIHLWSSVEQNRKKGWRLLSIVGLPVLIGAALRMLSLDQVLTRVGCKLGLSIAAVRLTNPLAGVDVDKPEDHTLVEAVLAGRA